MPDDEFWAARFEEYRLRLRAVAYRMLGSFAEADDALQETWLRVARAGGDDVANIGGWLTTIVSRQCLNMLRARSNRREDPLDVRMPDPVVESDDASDPAEQSAAVDSVGLALLAVLETLDPAERLAFVLHDMFAVPFDEIAAMVERTAASPRQLASRARRKVQGTRPDQRPDRARQREIVDAWLTAARGGDFDRLVELLHPDVVLRVDTGGAGSKLVQGATAVAGQATAFRAGNVRESFALVNAGPGIVATLNGRLAAIQALAVTQGLVSEINILSDPQRLASLHLDGGQYSTGSSHWE